MTELEQLEKWLRGNGSRACKIVRLGLTEVFLSLGEGFALDAIEVCGPTILDCLHDPKIQAVLSENV